MTLPETSMGSWTSDMISEQVAAATVWRKETVVVVVYTGIQRL